MSCTIEHRYHNAVWFMIKQQSTNIPGYFEAIMEVKPPRIEMGGLTHGTGDYDSLICRLYISQQIPAIVDEADALGHQTSVG